MKKKFDWAPVVVLSALLAGIILLVVFFVGRGQRSGERDAAEAGSIRLWHIMNYPGPREVLEDAVARFEKDNPGIKVSIETFDNNAYKEKIIQQMIAEEPPDVLHTWGGAMLRAFVEKDGLVDLTEALAQDGWRENLSPTAMQFCTVDGRAYAVPLDLSIVPVWYNKDIFSRLGLTTPKTWPEFETVCSTLKENNIIPLSLGNKDKWPGAFYFIYLATRLGGMEAFENAALNREGARFDAEHFVQAGRILQDMVKADCFPYGFNGLGEDQARTLFYTGKAGMYIMGTWTVANALSEKPDFADRMGCFSFPVPPGAVERTAVVGGTNCAFAVSANSRQREASVRLLRYLTDATTANGWARAGRLPAVKAGWERLQLPAAAQAALALHQESGAIQLYYDQYLPFALAERHKDTTQGLFTGDLTPEEAANQMAEAAAEYFESRAFRPGQPDRPFGGLLPSKEKP